MKFKDLPATWRKAIVSLLAVVLLLTIASILHVYLTLGSLLHVMWG